MLPQDFLLEVFCLVDYELQALNLGRLRRRGPRPRLADSEVLTIELVGAFWGLDRDQDLVRHFRRYHAREFPALAHVHRTTFARQAANLWHVKQLLQQRLALGVIPQSWDPPAGRPFVRPRWLRLSGTFVLRLSRSCNCSWFCPPVFEEETGKVLRISQSRSRSRTGLLFLAEDDLIYGRVLACRLVGRSSRPPGAAFLVAPRPCHRDNPSGIARCLDAGGPGGISKTPGPLCSLGPRASCRLTGDGQAGHAAFLLRFSPAAHLPLLD